MIKIFPLRNYSHYSMYIYTTVLFIAFSLEKTSRINLNSLYILFSRGLSDLIFLYQSLALSIVPEAVLTLSFHESFCPGSPNFTEIQFFLWFYIEFLPLSFHIPPIFWRLINVHSISWNVELYFCNCFKTSHKYD